MALNDIISTLIPTHAFDTVAIYNQNYEQLFRFARSIKAVVKEQAKVMEHPVENGTIITDHRIILPVEIELSLILKPEYYPDTYKAIRQYYLDSTLLIVQTKTGSYENQIIQSMPHEEDPSLYDTISIALTTKQVQFTVAKYGVIPKQPKNSTTQNRGMQQTKTNNSSVIYDAGSAGLNYAKSAFSNIKKFFTGS